MIPAGKRTIVYVQGDALRDTVAGVPIPYTAPDNDEIRRNMVSRLTPWFTVLSAIVESSTAADQWRATITLTPLMDMSEGDLRQVVFTAVSYDPTEVGTVIVTIGGDTPPLPPGPLSEVSKAIGDALGGIVKGAAEGLAQGGGLTLILVAAAAIAIVVLVRK